MFLNDREIGTHEFSLGKDGNTEQISSVADFEDKLLFVKLYDYEHENTQLWQCGCLARIDSSTNANGDEYRVQGRLDDAGFVLESDARGGRVLRYELL